jgi:hypothetical protein
MAGTATPATSIRLSAFWIFINLLLVERNRLGTQWGTSRNLFEKLAGGTCRSNRLKELF